MITNLGELKSSGYQSQSIKDELRNNLIKYLEAGTTVFEGVHGFETSVIPELEREFKRQRKNKQLRVKKETKKTPKTKNRRKQTKKRPRQKKI